MSQVNQLLESAAGSWKNLQSDAAKLAGKWARTGLLQGLGEVDKNNMSLMLENQAKQLVTETNVISTNSYFTSGTEGENWAGIALPLVRKVFGTIVAKEFVSVQPMNMPSGLVFFLDFQYGNTKNPFTAGDSLYGDRNAGGKYPFATPATEGGLYGAGRFAYSTNQFSASFASGSTAATDAVFAVATSESVNFDSRFYSQLDATGTQLYTITVNSSSLATSAPNWDFDAVSSFIITGTAATVAGNLQNFTTYNAATGAVTFVIAGDLTTPVTGNYVLNYSKVTTDQYRGDFEASSSYANPNAGFANAGASQIAIPEINVQMQSQAITAKTKKLKAVWTPEFAQDLAAYQNIDAEAELTNIMSEYISMEIDLEILDMLVTDAAAGTEYWSAENNQVWNGSAFAASTSDFYNTQGGWFQTLGTKMQKLSNKIHQLTLRGGANFLVTSPTVATILESIPGFSSNSNGDAAVGEYAFGVQKIGTINNRYKVYKNPYFTDNLILMGYRGTQFLETGAVFAPYIPLIMTPLVYDPETFTPRKGLMTRYAKKMLRPEYYGKIYVNGLETV
jgi:hypothetical protein